MRGPLNSALDFVDDGAGYRARRLARWEWRHGRPRDGHEPQRWRDLPLYAKVAALAVWALFGAVLIPAGIVAGSMLLQAL